MSAGTRDEVRANVATIRDRLTAACGRAGRDAGEVRIVAAAKTVPVSAIAWVVEAGVPDVGHNYVQELRESRPAVPGARWHFIGTLQTGLGAPRGRQRRRRADPRRAALGGAARAPRRRCRPRLQALIEVDLTGERSGVPPEEVPAFARRVAGLEGVELAGLMTLPPIPDRPRGRPAVLRPAPRAARPPARGPPQVVELSMGMSLDYEVAAEEGATMVRIGTALFGPRTPQ